MAIYYPTSQSSLKKIFGVGSRKLAKYGQIFSDVISEYCTEYNLVEKRKPRARVSKEKPSVEQIPKHIVVGEAYNAGASAQELMEQLGVQQGTILNHLSKYILEGHSLRSDEFLTLPISQMIYTKKPWTRLSRLAQSISNRFMRILAEPLVMTT